MVPDNSMWLFS